MTDTAFQTLPTNEVTAAWIKARSEFPPLKQTGFNTEAGRGGKAYATNADVEDCIQPTLAKHGLLWSVTPMQVTVKSVVVKGTLYHTSGQALHFDVMSFDTNDPNAGKVFLKGAHAAGSLITYAVRYYTVANFCLLKAEEDDDGNSASGRSSSPTPAAARQTGKTASPPNPKGGDRPDPKKNLQNWEVVGQAVTKTVPLVKHRTIEGTSKKSGKDFTIHIFETPSGYEFTTFNGDFAKDFAVQGTNKDWEVTYIPNERGEFIGRDIQSMVCTDPTQAEPDDSQDDLPADFPDDIPF